MKFSEFLILATISTTAAPAGLVEKSVTYQQGGTTLEGFHVYDDAVSGKRPAVLVIHQWTGLSDVRAADDARDARWVPISEFLHMQERMYEDHYFIANHFLGGLGLQ